MPYVERSTTVETPSIFGVKQRSYITYIPPEDYDEDEDELAELTPKQVREAREQYPEEYDAEGNYVGGLLDDVAFLEARWQEAVAEVTRHEGDPERLHHLAELEENREPPRRSVAMALIEAGVDVDVDVEESED